MINSFRSAFNLFCILFMVLLMVTRFMQDGMFFDGLIYASEARNFADGTGTFWHPYYFGITYEQPPLFFPMQGFFFTILGNGIYTERIYDFIIFSAVIWISVMIWKLVFKNHPGHQNLKQYGLLAGAIMITFNSFTWAFGNNILECTLCLFDLAAVYCMLMVISAEKNRMWYFLAGVFVVLAFFTKGLTGLGVLSFPFWSFIFLSRSFKKICYDYLLLSIPLLGTTIFIIYNPAPHQFFSVYFISQVLGSIEGKRETVESAWGHFWVLKELLFYEISIIIGILIILFMLFRDTITASLSKENKNLAFFFLAIALSCSLPILVSIKQRAFYLTPSFPYFALGFAVLLSPYLLALKLKLERGLWLKRINYFLFAGLICSLILCIFIMGTIGRDEDEVLLMRDIQSKVKYNTTIGIVPVMDDDYSLKAYLSRYQKVITTIYYIRCDTVLQDSRIAADSVFENTMVKNNYTKAPVGKANTFYLWTR